MIRVNWTLFAEKAPPNTLVRKRRFSGRMTYRLSRPRSQTYRFQKGAEGLLMAPTDQSRTLIRVMAFECSDVIVTPVQDLDFFLGGQWVTFDELGVTLPEETPLTLGQRFTWAREQAGLSILQMVLVSGLRMDVLEGIEDDIRDPFLVEDVSFWSRYYDVSEEWLKTGVERAVLLPLQMLNATPKEREDLRCLLARRRQDDPTEGA